MEHKTHSPRITRIRRPPRPLPAGLWCRVLLNPKGLFWLCFASFWIFILCFCSGDMRPLGVLPLRLWGRRVTARVTSVQELNGKINGRPYERVRYTFQTDAGAREAEAYDTVVWKPGEEASAIYWPAHPAVSRLFRADQTRFGLMGLSLWVLPLAALLFAAPPWRDGVLQALLLREGSVADGRFIAYQRLKRRLRGETLFHYAYEFDADGARVLGQCDGFPSDDEERALEKTPHGVVTFAPYQAPVKPVLFLSRETDVSILVDALPARYDLGVDKDGYWVLEKTWAPIAAASLAAAAAALALFSALFCAAGWLPNLGR